MKLSSRYYEFSNATMINRVQLGHLIRTKNPTSSEMDFNLDAFGQPGPNPQPSYSEPVHQVIFMINSMGQMFTENKIN